MTPTRVVLVDDHPVVRAGVRSVLQEAGIEVIGEAANAEEGLRLVEELRPDVLILDIMLPGMSGTELIAILKSRPSTHATATLALSALDSEAHAMASLSAGANGYVLKDEAPETIAQAVEAAARGHHWISPRIVARVSSLIARGRSAEITLTTRERQILRHIAQGLPNAEIGQELMIAEQTVKNHVSAIYSKLGVNSRVSAAIRALILGLITWDEVE